MVKSIRLFLLLALIFFLSDRALFFVLKTLNDRVYTGQGVGKVNTFLKEKDSVDLLIFGSSRAAHHIDLNSAEISSYNMGRDATKIAFTGALISTLNKEEQIILVHIDHEWLFYNSYEGNDILPLRLNALLNEDIHDYFEEFYSEELILSEIAHTYAGNGKILSIVKNTISKGFDYAENKGYEPIFPTGGQQSIFEKSLKTEGLYLNEGIEEPLDINPQFVAILDAIVKKAVMNKAKLIFLTSPSLNKVDNKVKRATKNLFDSKGLIYWDHIDYFKDVIIGDWKDRTHLSHTGAAKYSEYLGKELSLSN